MEHDKHNRHNARRRTEKAKRIEAAPEPAPQPKELAHAEPSDLTDSDAAMLFEAAEAFVRAISTEDPAQGEQAAIERAMQAEALAPFDGPVVNEAVAFLRRMGYFERKAA
ncbi:MAG: hypothetical protein KDA05_05695 [Phycisphaerales bacterium]|nr:hypothetical protein [Phycisphaerales bacterium]MCB9841302.1 hypothetical protein [Phycisphaeraceae bacterium]